jgi:hypothetical protein
MKNKDKLKTKTLGVIVLLRSLNQIKQQDIFRIRLANTAV